jgi:hypothetical protein
MSWPAALLIGVLSAVHGTAIAAAVADYAMEAHNVSNFEGAPAARVIRGSIAVLLLRLAERNYSESALRARSNSPGCQALHRPTPVRIRDTSSRTTSSQPQAPQYIRTFHLAE